MKKNLILALSVSVIGTSVVAAPTTHWFINATENQADNYVSNDGNAWTSIANQKLNFSTYYHYIWLGLGKSENIYTSYDANKWDLLLPTAKLNSLAESENFQLMAVGDKALIYTSDDGQVWSPKFNFPIPTNLNAVSYGKDAAGVGKWVVVGTNAVIGVSSDNGLTWSIAKPPVDFDVNLKSISYGVNAETKQGVWVVVGDHGVILTSNDGMQWDERVNPKNSYTLNQVYFGKDFAKINLWMAVGNNGTILSSYDAIHWSVQNNSQGSANLNSISYSNGEWVAVGDAGALINSPDGNTWFDRSLTTQSNLLSVNADGYNPAPVLGTTSQIINDTTCVRNNNGTYTRTGTPTPLYFFTNNTSYTGLVLQPGANADHIPTGVSTSMFSPQMSAIYVGYNKQHASLGIAPAPSATSGSSFYWSINAKSTAPKMMTLPQGTDAVGKNYIYWNDGNLKVFHGSDPCEV